MGVAGRRRGRAGRGAGRAACSFPKAAASAARSGAPSASTHSSAARLWRRPATIITRGSGGRGARRWRARRGRGRARRRPAVGDPLDHHWDVWLHEVAPELLVAQRARVAPRDLRDLRARCLPAARCALAAAACANPAPRQCCVHHVVGEGGACRVVPSSCLHGRACLICTPGCPLLQPCPSPEPAPLAPQRCPD